jgi:hypothetical protein
VIPFWVSPSSYTDYLGTTGNLTQFPVEFSLENFGLYYWGVKQWRLSGEFTYRIPDVVGVSWGPDVTEAFSVDLTEFLIGAPEVENNRVLNSGYRFTGTHVGVQGFAADFHWFRTLELNPTPEILWSGNHGAASGNVKPGFMLRVVFDNTGDFSLRELRTDMPVSLRLGEVDTQIADVTFAGQSFEWHTGYNATPDAGTCQMSVFTAELTPLEYFEFRDSNGNNPVWNSGTGTQLIDPRTT